MPVLRAPKVCLPSICEQTESKIISISLASPWKPCTRQKVYFKLMEVVESLFIQQFISPSFITCFQLIYDNVTLTSQSGKQANLPSVCRQAESKLIYLPNASPWKPLKFPEINVKLIEDVELVVL